MWKAKYVVINKRQVFVFSETAKHNRFQHNNVTSAGFVSFSGDHNGQVVASTYGESTSLEMKPAQRRRTFDRATNLRSNMKKSLFLSDTERDIYHHTVDGVQFTLYQNKKNGTVQAHCNRNNAPRFVDNFDTLDGAVTALPSWLSKYIESESRHILATREKMKRNYARAHTSLQLQ